VGKEAGKPGDNQAPNPVKTTRDSL